MERLLLYNLLLENMPLSEINEYIIITSTVVVIVVVVVTVT